jgi:hypothetical protein
MTDVMRSYRAIAGLTAAISGLVTIAFARLPQLHLGYAWPAVRLALETSGSLVALFATFLVFGRLRRRTYLNELLLACALAVLALSNLLFVTVPTVAGEAPDDLTVWAAPLARLLGALLFVLAAFATRHELRRGGPVLALAAVATLAALGTASLFAHTFAARWAPRDAATLSPLAVSQPPLRAHPALFVFELLVALLYGLAAIGFLNLATRRRDAFYGWLAAEPANVVSIVVPVGGPRSGWVPGSGAVQGWLRPMLPGWQMPIGRSDELADRLDQRFALATCSFRRTAWPLRPPVAVPHRRQDDEHNGETE